MRDYRTTDESSETPLLFLIWIPYLALERPSVTSDDDRELQSASRSLAKNFPAPPTSQEFAAKFEIYYRHFLPPPPQTPIVKKTDGRAGAGRIGGFLVPSGRKGRERLGFYHKR